MSKLTDEIQTLIDEAEVLLDNADELDVTDMTDSVLGAIVRLSRARRLAAKMKLSITSRGVEAIIAEQWAAARSIILTAISGDKS